ncbi:MAG TPA: ATP synthase F1 subunit delta [Dissulfurispiraceae bacterium]
MKKVKGIRKYAKQFLSAVDLNEAQQAIGQLSAVAELMEKDKKFRNIMTSPIFNEAEIKRLFEYMSQRLKMSDKTTKYLLYLSASGALHALSEIVKAIVGLYLEMKKRAKVVVTTPVKISKSYEETLIGSLKQLTGREVDLEYVMDPSLLGGIRLQVGSTMYDGSLKGQLGLLKDKLIKG